MPPYATVDPRAIARTHFEELNRYLATYLAKGIDSLLILSVPVLRQLQ